jgi:DNA-binding beta-propeller fold protein YncE
VTTARKLWRNAGPGPAGYSASLRLATFCLFSAVLAACGQQEGLPADSGRGVRYPIALTASPDGQRVYVVGANFDRKFRSGSVGTIDTASQAWIGQVSETEGFAGGAALQVSSASQALRLLVTSREHDGLAVMDIDPASPAKLSCGSIDADGRCADSHHYGSAIGSVTVGNDPMGIEILPWDQQGWRVHVAAAGDGKVSVIKLSADGKLTSIGTTGFGTGLSHIRTVPRTGRTYISDNRAPQLHVFRLDPEVGTASGWKVVPEASVSLPSSSLQDYGRGMALSADGARLYLADRSPASLVIIDVAPDSAGVPRNAVMGVIPLIGKPSEVAVAASGEKGKELVYVSCFGDDSVWVVDPWLRSVVDVIRLPHAPYGLAAVKVPGLDGQTPATWTLYAGLFARHAVAVVPLSPGHAKRHQLSALLESE